MKSMEYKSTKYNRLSYPIFHTSVVEKIGQFVYDQPDVFSFFSADFSPSVKFARGSLVSPEAAAITMKSTIGFSNGLFSLIRHGMNRCDAGFGNTPMATCRRFSDNSYLPVGFFENSSG